MGAGTVHGPHNLSNHGHEESRIHFPLSCTDSKTNLERHYQQHYDVSANYTTHG